VIVLAAGRVMGDISASKISVADGSQFKGKIKIQAPGV
jgi:cytoskeletal protein CcmA (bactofilin family)